MRFSYLFSTAIILVALSACKPIESIEPTPRPGSTLAPTIVTPAADPTKPAPELPVVPGSYCKHAGAQAFSRGGTPLVCTTSPTDNRLRWRELR